MSGTPQIWTPVRDQWLIAQITAQVGAKGRMDWGAMASTEVSAAACKCRYQTLSMSGRSPRIAAMILDYRRGQPIPQHFPIPDKPESRAEPDIDPVVAAQQRLERRAEMRGDREDLEAVAGEKSFRRMLEQLCRETVQALPAVPAYRRPKVEEGATEESVFQLLSDFHGGEVVSVERTRGFNAFSTAILAQRVKRIVDSHISIKQRMERSKGWTFKELIIGLNGDLVSGTIHEIERHSDAKNVIMAVYAVGMILAQAIRDLAAQYPSVRIYCTSGNHGRLPDARLVQQKDPTRSWDTMIALLAKEHLRNTSHVTFHIPDAYAVAYDIETWTFLQTHGHDVKSWNSIPWYGLNRLVGNLNALEASRRQTIHYWLFGHFHSKSSLDHASGESFINGSLIGGTEYSVNAMGKSDRPTQWMLCVHKEHGVTSRWPLLGACKPDAPSYIVPPETLAI